MALWYLPASLRARLIAALTPFFARRARTSAFLLRLEVPKVAQVLTVQPEGFEAGGH